MVVRGHEPCQGYSIDHGGRVITIFTTKEAYPSFGAAYIAVDKAGLESIKNAYDLVPYVKRLDL